MDNINIFTAQQILDNLKILQIYLKYLLQAKRVSFLPAYEINQKNIKET